MKEVTVTEQDQFDSKKSAKASKEFIEIKPDNNISAEDHGNIIAKNTKKKVKVKNARQKAARNTSSTKTQD